MNTPTKEKNLEVNQSYFDTIIKTEQSLIEAANELRYLPTYEVSQEVASKVSSFEDRILMLLDDLQNFRITLKILQA